MGIESEVRVLLDQENLPNPALNHEGKDQRQLAGYVIVPSLI
jgi:hypothetical protein